MEDEVRANMKFFGVGDTDKHTLTAYCNTDGRIYIEIEMQGEMPSFIVLNKATAIKLVKTLKAEISYIEM
jgi:hypothetical protein